MTAYTLDVDNDNILRIGFKDPAQNDVLVVEATQRINELVKSGQLSGGELLRVNGPASLPIAMAIAHGVCHLYQAIACYDPKINKYVVAIAHGNNYSVGDLLD